MVVAERWAPITVAPKNPMQANLHIFDSLEELFQRSAEQFLKLSEQAIASRGSFHAALAGGSTPRRLYQLLSSPGYAEAVQWKNIHLYFGDERCVPPDHINSNYRMVKETLLPGLGKTLPTLHRIRTELPPDKAAEDYASVLHQQLPRDSDGNIYLDLVLLGVGSDGHVASLFPGTPILEERERTVAAVYVEKLCSWRISLTLPVINRARQIIILVSGEKKADILRHVHHAIPCAAPLPVQLLKPEGKLDWYLDSDAAQCL